MFVPDKVKVPEPDFIIEPVPDVSVILPAYVVFDDWLIVKDAFWISITPVLVPVIEATVSLLPILKVPCTSKLTVSAKLPSPDEKIAVVYLSISKVPVPVTWSLKSYIRELVPSVINVKVLLPNATAVVVLLSALPKNILPLIDPVFGLCKTDASAFNVTVPVRVAFAPELVVRVAAVPPFILLFPEPDKLISTPYVLPPPVPG